MAAAVPFLVGAGTAAAVGASVGVAIAVGLASVVVMDYIIDEAMQDAYSPLEPTQDTMSSRNVTAKNPVGTREIVYGKTRKGGVIVWQHVHGSDSYSDVDEFLGIVVAWHHGEAEEIETIYLGDEIAWHNGYYKDRFASNGTSSATGNKIIIVNKLGTQGQSAVTLTGTALTWTTSHRLRGVTYTRIQFEYDVDQYPNGVPKVTAVIKGRKIYDPRDATHSTTSHSNWDWSSNPVLCLLDYMKYAPYKEWGLQIDASKFDMDQIADAANYCDANVGGGTAERKRYSCHGVVSTKATHKENIQNILSCMNGKLLFIDGKFQIVPHQYADVHETTLTEDMIIGDFIISNTNPRRVAFNEVRGEYISAEANYVKTEYPPQQSATYSDDDNDNLRKNLNLPFTTDMLQAQRLAHLHLLKSRMQKTLKTTINARGIDYAVGDNIKVTNTALAITDNIYEITSLRLQSTENGITIDLEARENAPEIYNHTSSTEQEFVTGDSVNIPTRSIAPRVSLDTINIGAVPYRTENGYKTGIAVSWEHPPALRLNYYQIGLGEGSGVPTWKFKKYTTTNNYITIPNETGQADVKVSIYAYGINQSRSYETTKTFDNGEEFDEVSDLPLIIYGDASIVPTDDDFTEYFGRVPVNGEQVTIIEVDDDGNAIDSKIYTYQNPIDLFSHPDNDTNFTMEQNDAHSPNLLFAFFVAESLANENGVTWSTSVSNFETNATLTQPTFNTLDFGNVQGEYAFRVQAVIAPADLNSLNPVNDKSLPAEEQFDVDVAYVKYDLTVTASWVSGGGKSRTRTVPIYLQVTGHLDQG